eukprot:TRINITY_DN12469_c0_g1_i3.p1 TRINITY_DN12469_c0_g1~~TRINITY_DN12469_c0_g1_i3.p1  ORF type:complete len:593 (+),score=81.70 TRINITY_DN12469_c0_g1_i3:38-1816(+)
MASPKALDPRRLKGFSFGDRISTMSVVNDIPGPGTYYNPRSSEITYTRLPKLVMPRANRFSASEATEHSKSPSPGHYIPQEINKHVSTATLTRSKRPDIFSASQTGQTGPGSYSVNEQAVLADSKGRLSVMSQKTLSSYLKMSEVPGPGAYNMEHAASPNKEKNRYSFSKSVKDTTKFLLNTSNSPGPAAYEAKEKSRNTFYSMGTSLRSDFANIKYKPTVNIGPGQYEPDEWKERLTESEFDKDKKFKKGSTVKGTSFGKSPKFVWRRRDMDVSPGPGNYDVVRSSKQSGGESRSRSPVNFNNKAVKTDSTLQSMSSASSPLKALVDRAAHAKQKYNKTVSSLTSSQHTSKVLVDRETSSSMKSMRAQYIFDPKTPGPGTYDITTGEMGYEATKSREARRKTSKDSVLSTGSRGTRGSRKGSSDSIGSRGSSLGSKHSKERVNGRRESPGPGTYEVSESFTKSSSRKKGFVKLNKTGHGDSKFLILNEFSPGPIYMTPYEKVPGLISTISKLGKPEFGAGIALTPGPGEYNVAEAYEKLMSFRREIQKRKEKKKGGLYEQHCTPSLCCCLKILIMPTAHYNMVITLSSFIC